MAIWHVFLSISTMVGDKIRAPTVNMSIFEALKRRLVVEFRGMAAYERVEDK